MDHLPFRHGFTGNAISQFQAGDLDDMGKEPFARDVFQSLLMVELNPKDRCRLCIQLAEGLNQ